jgi:triosephosphate isomerase
MRKSIIAGNWKMHKSPAETKAFFKELLSKHLSSDVRILLAVPFLDIVDAVITTQGSAIEIGAQTLSEHSCGAYTGEVAGSMLKEAGVSFVLIGHSERRTLFHETKEVIREKMKKALECQITPILCFGETLSDRQQGKAGQILQEQLYDALSAIRPEDLSKVILAYEPVWAIGTGQTASPEVAQETHRACRDFLRTTWGSNFSDHVSILYGGSVKSDNIGALMKQKDIDGALVGGASLDPVGFAAIINF